MTGTPANGTPSRGILGGSTRLGRRAFLGGVAGAGGALALGGCGGSGSGSGGSTTIQIWDISLEQKKLHQAAAKEFERTHKGVTIDWRSIQEAQYDQTLPLAFRSGKAPDLFQYGGQGARSLSYAIEQGWARPLDPDGNDIPAAVKKRWPDPEQNIPAGILTHEGKTYGLPFNDRRIYGAGFMFLHNKLFQQAGLDPMDDAPKTWSELRSVCAQLKKRTGKAPIIAGMKDNGLNRMFNGGLLSGVMNAGAGGGGAEFDLKTGRFDMDAELVQQTFEFTQSLYNAGYIRKGLFDKDFARGQFAAGEASIYFDGSYMTGVWKSNGFDESNYTVHSHPYGDPGMPRGALGYDLGQGSFWINAHTKNPKACWEFMEWFSDPKGWYATHYIEGGFGFILGADNAAHLKSAADRRVVDIATKDHFRVIMPMPELKCPASANSQAYTNATTKHPEWETESRTQALLDNSDLKATAHKVASTRQQDFEAGLKKEQAKGTDVSLDCYTFPDWSYTEDYPMSKYPKN